jgi:hypothetical protein
VELQVRKQNDVEVGDEVGVKLFCTNQFTQKLKLIGKGGQTIYTLILPLTCSYLGSRHGIGVVHNLFLFFYKLSLDGFELETSISGTMLSYYA